MPDTDVIPNTDNTNTQPTELQADQYAENASNIDADKPVPMTGAPPGVPPVGPNVNPTVNPQGQPVAPNAQQNVQNLAKQQPQVNQPNPKAPPEVTQKASWVHDIAETLAGGQRYTYNVNPETGKMEKTQVPVSGKHLAMAIALEAIGGAANGLAYGKGAGNMGKGAAAAFSQGQKVGQNVQQQNEQARQQANADYARKAAIAQTNMRMAMNMRTLSQYDEQMHSQYVKDYAPLYEMAQQVPGAVSQVAHGEDELNTLLKPGPDGKSPLGVDRHNAIPIRYYPKVDADGKPMKGANGEQLFDYDFAIINPTSKFVIPKEMHDMFVANNEPGFVSNGKEIPLPSDWETASHMIINATEKAHTTMNAQAAGDQLYNKYVSDSTKRQQAEGTSTTTLPTLKDYLTGTSGTPDFDKMADAIQKHEGTDPKNVNIRNNNPGNIVYNENTKKYPGVVGFEQVGDNKFAKFDSFQNGRSALVKKLEGDYDKYGNQPLDQYINQHYSPDNAPGNKPGQALAYAKDLAGITGSVAGEEGTFKPQMSQADIKTEVAKLSPKQKELFGQKDLFYDGGEGKISTAEKLSEPDANGKTRYTPQDVGVVKNLLNRIYPMDEYYDNQQANKQNIAAAGAASKEAGKLSADEAQDLKSHAFLQEPNGWSGPPANLMDMSMEQAKDQLRKSGVTIPPNFADLWSVANNRSKLSTHYASKTYAKSSLISAQDAGSYINQFLNPNWSEGQYEVANKQRMEMLPSGKQGQIIYNSGVASQHLDLARELFDNMNNGSWQGWNEAKNAFGVQFGQAAPAVYKTVADVLADEVAKVVGGVSGAKVADTENFRKDLPTSATPAAAKGTLNSLIELMYPRVHDLNSSNRQILGQEVHVSPTAAKVFGFTPTDSGRYVASNHYVPGYGWPKVNGKTGQLGFTRDGKTVTLFDPNAEDNAYSQWLARDPEYAGKR